MTRRCLQPHRWKIIGNPQLGVGNAGGGIPSRWLAIALTLFVTGAWHCPRAVAHSAAGSDAQDIAPHQSVSLDQAAVGAKAQNADETLREAVGPISSLPSIEAAEAQESDSRAVDREPPIGGRQLPPAGSPRYVRPRFGRPAVEADATAAGLTDSDQLAWYRTGLGALAIVLAVVGAVYWLARRWMPGVRSIEGGVLSVTGRATLTPKHSAALIKLGRRFVLVGISPERVSLLCEISDPDEVAELAARTASPSARPSALADRPLAVADPCGSPEVGKAFDRLLAGEAAEYGMEAKEENHESPVGDRQLPTTGFGSGKTTRSLGDLLNRLRILQSK